MTNNVQTPGGNTTTAGAVDGLADKIVTTALCSLVKFPETAGEFRYAMREIALAAILETTEAAAKMIDHQTPPPVGGPLSHTNSMRVVMQDAARSLRNNAHLKAPQP